MGTHAVVAALVVALGCWASVASLDATAVRARTPAEIERRRDDIALRLATIEHDAAVAAQRCAEPAERPSMPDDAIPSTLDLRRQECRARLAALAEEKATLEREQALLAAVHTRNATGPLQPADPQGVTPLDVTGQSAQVTSAQSFNPALSVIPDIAYYNDNRQGQTGEPLERGFNLREVEVAFSGSVDPYFDVWATFAIDADGIDSEEVYVQTRKFLPGVQLRVGKFFSGIGYLNRQHPHQWDFADQALSYDVLLGGNLGEVGLQATWLPNLPVYTLLGFEALQGDNTRVSQQLSDAYPGTFAERPGPRLFTGFLKVAPDAGYSDAIQGGVSFGRSRSHQEAIVTGELLDEALDGTAWFAGTDWVWRHDSPRPLGRGDLAVQGEYLYRRRDLATVPIGDPAIAGGAPFTATLDGLYAQATYGVAPRWTLGGRVDVVGVTNRVDPDGHTTGDEASRRYSAALTFNPTEFSRLRAQYSAGDVRKGDRHTVKQVYVQFQMSLGAHGAHRF